MLFRSGEGIIDETDRKAEMLFRELWCNGDRALFPEVTEVLQYFRRHGYRMGVISDTSPSLEYTLQQLGISCYFTSFTASSLVGSGKPDPAIYEAALRSQNVSAQDSLYVDDTEEEAEGARRLGFTSFYLDRNGKAAGPWTVHDLQQIVQYVENQA